jgi:hypothetical protein
VTGGTTASGCSAPSASAWGRPAALSAFKCRRSRGRQSALRLSSSTPPRELPRTTPGGVQLAPLEVGHSHEYGRGGRCGASHPRIRAVTHAQLISEADEVPSRPTCLLSSHLRPGVRRPPTTSITGRWTLADAARRSCRCRGCGAVAHRRCTRRWASLDRAVRAAARIAFAEEIVDGPLTTSRNTTARSSLTTRWRVGGSSAAWSLSMSDQRFHR